MSDPQQRQAEVAPGYKTSLQCTQETANLPPSSQKRSIKAYEGHTTPAKRTELANTQPAAAHPLLPSLSSKATRGTDTPLTVTLPCKLRLETSTPHINTHLEYIKPLCCFPRDHWREYTACCVAQHIYERRLLLAVAWRDATTATATTKTADGSARERVRNSSRLPLSGRHRSSDARVPRSAGLCFRVWWLHFGVCARRRCGVRWSRCHCGALSLQGQHQEED